MEWMLHEGEEAPALFADPVYARMKVWKVVTSSFETGWLEDGFVYPVPGSIIVYFEVKEQSVAFSIFGNDADASAFGDLLEGSAADIASILDGM